VALAEWASSRLNQMMMTEKFVEAPAASLHAPPVDFFKKLLIKNVK
jgi:hypothetical protein